MINLKQHQEHHAYIQDLVKSIEASHELYHVKKINILVVLDDYKKYLVKHGFGGLEIEKIIELIEVRE